jgi:uncharacterized membrane protein YbaN (DUF454 family)
MARALYLLLGGVSLALGLLGLFLPLLPTVPFLILAAFAFGRSQPAFERWLLAHPRFGQPIRTWREHRAISRKGKLGATAAFLASAIAGLLLAPWPWGLLPPAVAAIGLSWIWSRPAPPPAS